MHYKHTKRIPVRVFKDNIDVVNFYEKCEQQDNTYTYGWEYAMPSLPLRGLKF